MKIARLFLAAATVVTLAACGDSVTAPVAEPTAVPAQTTDCTLEKQADGSYACRTGQGGSGG